jgi:hypothetical protein
MPYVIRKYQSGWRVYSVNGTPLSHKPLTLQQASKQKTAVTLEMLRRQGRLRGGGTGGGEEDYSLSDTDIQKIIGGTSIFRYPELDKMNSIEDAFDSEGRCMFLYLTEDEDTGHWCCMIKKGSNIEFFDPYGGLKPDGERKWLSKEKLEALGEDEPILTRMLKGYKVTSNPYHFQKLKNDVNTCGRHCCVRLLMAHLSLPEYHKMIASSGVEPDDFVTTFTSQVLKK